MLTLEIDQRGVATLMLNRPERHNAFNAELIAQLTSALEQLVNTDQTVRALIVTGAGRSFSAGADLHWMQSMCTASEMDNRADATRLAGLFRSLDELPIPTIGKVNGAAYGGGIGLISCCDIAVAKRTARFALTEVRLGLIPATIAPFVIERIGMTAARRLFLTAESIDAQQAQALGLISEAVDDEQLDDHVESILADLLAAGPQAIDQCKQLIRRIRNFDGNPRQLDAMTADWIARLRVSEEGQHGLNAFLNKQAPDWINRPEDRS